MRVLITGGTGLVGCHTTARLRERGHEVRLLVRDPTRVSRALRPLGAEPVEHHVGDVTDEAAVERALAGCDAAVHAAAVFTLDRRRAAEVQHTNVAGTRNVLGCAARLGLDPIIHVSSVSALFPADGPTLTPDTSVKRPLDMYASSKAEAERIARELQAQGKPVVCVYPGQIWGPHDPTLGDGIRAMLGFLKLGVLPVTPGGIPITDVRDLATLHAALLVRGRGPRRFMAPGHFLAGSALADLLAELTGRRFLRPVIPGALMRGYGRLVDVVQRVSGVVLGPSYEAMLTLTEGVPCDDTRTRSELGISARPARETFADTLSWMAEQGIVEPRHVGRLGVARG